MHDLRHHLCAWLQKAKAHDMGQQLGEQAALLQQFADEKAQLEAQVALLQQEAAQRIALQQQQEPVEESPGLSPPDTEVSDNVCCMQCNPCAGNPCAGMALWRDVRGRMHGIACSGGLQARGCRLAQGAACEQEAPH
jgi:hypothetical protein